MTITRVSAHISAGSLEYDVEYVIDTSDASAAMKYVEDLLKSRDIDIISIRSQTTWLHKIQE